MYLYNMNGVNCGVAGEGLAPEGYWLRDEESQDSMPSIYFLERIGKDAFFALWQVALTNPELLFQMFRGFAAQNILITESFPALYQFEQMGLLPKGTAIRVWS